VWTVPFQFGGPHVSSEAVAEMPRESAVPGSSARTSVIWTVSWSIEPAKQATLSLLDCALSSQSVCSSVRALLSNRKARGMLLGLAATSAVAVLRVTSQCNVAMSGDGCSAW
jgi:hypothetical protein